MIKFSIQRENIIQPLEQVVSSIGSNQKETITQNVLIRVIQNDGSEIKDAPYILQLVCTDTEIELMTKIGLYGDDIVEGATTVDAKTLQEIIKSMPEGCFINFYENDDTSIVVSTDRNTFNLKTKPAEQFPDIDALESKFSLKIKASVLLNLMKTTSFSIASENYRFVLKGMCFNFETDRGPKALDVYTADGHRLSIQTGTLEEECVVPSDYTKGGKFIFPRKGVLELIKLLSSQPKDANNQDPIVELAISENSLRTNVNGTSIISRLIDGVFPDVLYVVPQNCNRIISVDREEFRNTVSRVKILCSKKSNAIEFVVKDGKITLKAKNNQHEEASERLIADYQGDDFCLAYNAMYLIDICNVITTPKIKISMSTNSNNAMLEPVLEESDKHDELSQGCYIVSRIML